MKNKLVLLIKGFIVGSTMLVPGVSGGSMAMILGIYEDLISSINNFLKKFKTSIIFLLLFSIGAFIGMALFSKSILSLLDNHYMPVMYFFIGAVMGGIPMIVKSCGLKRLNLSSIIFTIIGAIAVMSITFIPQGLFDATNLNSIQGFLILFIAGFVTAIALVLPGISVSFVLLVIGIYEELVKAIDTFNVPYLFVLGIGLLVGIFATTNILNKAMTKYKRPTYLIILGFVLGSVIPVFPGSPMGINLIICPVTFILGIGFIQLLYLLDK